MLNASLGKFSAPVERRHSKRFTMKRGMTRRHLWHPESFGAESEFVLERHAAFPPLSSSGSQEEFLDLPGLAACPAPLWDWNGSCAAAGSDHTASSMKDLREVCDGSGCSKTRIRSDGSSNLISSHTRASFIKRSNLGFMNFSIRSHSQLCWTILIFFFFWIGSVAFGPAAGSYRSLTWLHLSPETPCMCPSVSWALIIKTAAQFQSVSFQMSLNWLRKYPEGNHCFLLRPLNKVTAVDVWPHCWQMMMTEICWWVMRENPS